MYFDFGICAINFVS